VLAAISPAPQYLLVAVVVPRAGRRTGLYLIDDNGKVKTE